MTDPLRGLHHVTAVTGDARRCLDFYTGVLGLRNVKRTVNFDAPTSWHLYLSDRSGTPGTVLTFFVWPRLPSGRPGPGQVTRVAFAAPEGSLDRWDARLQEEGIDARRASTPWGEGLLFEDPDGMGLALVASGDAAKAGPEPRTRDGSGAATGGAAGGVDPWTGGPVGAEMALRGFRGVELTVESPDPTRDLLAETMGIGAAPSGPAAVSAAREGTAAGRGGVGAVHHVAWRAADRDAQEAWRGRLLDRGLEVTPVVDRHYFTSIYFREPGGVLFEIATEGPGFTVDESVEELGSGLRLPPWLQDRRETIEANLPEL